MRARGRGWWGGALTALVTLLTAAACGPARPPVATPRVTTVLTAPKVTAGELDARIVLADVPARALRGGAGPLAVVASSEAVDGDRVGGFVEFPLDTCLLGYARGSASVEDLDLAAFAEDGTPIVVDERQDSHPTILLCPPHPGRIYLAAKVTAGDGLVALGAHVVPRDRATDMARAMGARGGDGEGPRPADGWPGIDDHVRPHRKALGGRWEEFRKVAITVDPRAPTYLGFPMEADQCVDAVVVPDDDVGQLEVDALDEGGRTMARAREGGRTRTMTLCSPTAMTASLAIRPHAGRGLAAVVLARARGEVAKDMASRADVAWTAATQSLDAARAKRNQELAKAGYGAGQPVATGALVIGRRVSVPVELRGAKGCDRIDVLAGAPLSLFEASLWDDAGALVSSGDGADAVTLFACGKGKARLDLEVRGRPGPFGVVQRPERWQHPAFASFPLAAARMLGRAAEGSRIVAEGAVVSTKAVSVDPAHPAAWDEVVPDGKCLRVTAGAQGDGSGLLLRIFDGGTQEELDRSHGAVAVSALGCGPPGAPRPVRVEVRATAGRLDVVAGVRAN